VGLTARCVVPMRFRDRTIGEVNLFCRGGGLSETQLGDARLLASLATVALLTHRALDRREAVVQRLQSVLNDRITIEQAKGVVAERESLTPSVALQRLRDEAERDRVTLSAVAHRVVTDQERRARPGPPPGS